MAVVGGAEVVVGTVLELIDETGSADDVELTGGLMDVEELIGGVMDVEDWGSTLPN